MKKLLLVFTVAAFLTACNGNSSSTEATTQIQQQLAQLQTQHALLMDSTKMATADTTSKMSADTTK